MNIQLICRAMIIALYAMALGINIAKHGQSKEGEHYSAGAAFVAVALIIALMYGAGTFD